LTSPAATYFSMLSHKGNNFRKEIVIEHKIRVFIFYTTFYETSLILRRNAQDVIKEVYWFLCKVSVIILRF